MKAIGTKRCSSKRHSEGVLKYPKIETETIAINNKRKVPQSVSKYINKETDWFENAKKDRVPNLCSSCISWAIELTNDNITQESNAINESKENENDDSKLSSEVLGIMAKIRGNFYSKKEISAICMEIGETQISTFKRIVSNQKFGTDKKHDLINSAYANTWQQFEGTAIRSMFEGLCDLSNCSLEYKKSSIKHLATALLSIGMALNHRFVSPISAAQNIVLHSYANSKMASHLFGSLHPSGGYTFLGQLVDTVSRSAPIMPIGDISVAFDNQQIIGREWSISLKGQPTSTVTSIAVFKEEIDLKAQYSPIPTDLSIGKRNRGMLWQKYQKFDESSRKVHSKFRLTWIEQRLKIIIKEFKIERGNLGCDAVQKYISSKEYETGLEYSRVPSFASNCKITDMENMLINPNSYKNVEKVLSNILNKSEEVSPDRLWIPVYCDGVPYSIGCKLRTNFLICEFCNLEGMSLKCQKLGHPVKQKFTKILLRPGAGHFELNLVRSIFGAYFDVFIEPVAKMLGFTTPRALDYCKKALDHHKSWKILQILFVTLTDELLNLFLVKWSNSGTTESPSVQTFVEWCSSHESPTIRIISDFVFNVLHPLFLFRAGVRQCNDEIAKAGLHIASEVFFGFNHPKYRYITVRDCLYILSLPVIFAGPAKRDGFCKAGSETGQGLDFLLEERNKLQKQWVFSHGVPTDEQWKKASSSLTFFEQMKAKVLDDMDIKEDSKRRQINFGDIYILVRKHFRKILEGEFSEFRTFTVPPVKLPIEFLNCAITCKNNKLKYVKAFLNNEKCVLNLCDSTNLETLSLEEIKKRCQSKIRQFAGDSKDVFTRKQTLCKTVYDYIELLGEIEEEICEIDYSINI